MSDDKDRNGESDADVALWAAAVKDVEPLRGRERADIKRVQKVSIDRVKASAKRHADQLECIAKDKGNRPDRKSREVDAGTLRKLRAGQVTIEGRLDLHGMNRGEARESLIRTLIAAQGAGKRCVLVITGKGKSGKRAGDALLSGDGVLKRSVPEWLNEAPLRDIVLAAQSAMPKHGGEGALYVYLRRLRG